MAKHPAGGFALCEMNRTEVPHTQCTRQSQLINEGLREILNKRLPTILTTTSFIKVPITLSIMLQEYPITGIYTLQYSSPTHLAMYSVQLRYNIGRVVYPHQPSQKLYLPVVTSSVAKKARETFRNENIQHFSYLSLSLSLSLSEQVFLYYFQATSIRYIQQEFRKSITGLHFALHRSHMSETNGGSMSLIFISIAALYWIQSLLDLHAVRWPGREMGGQTSRCCCCEWYSRSLEQVTARRHSNDDESSSSTTIRRGIFITIVYTHITFEYDVCACIALSCCWLLGLVTTHLATWRYDRHAQLAASTRSHSFILFVFKFFSYDTSVLCMVILLLFFFQLLTLY